MTINEIEDFLDGKYGDKSVEDMLEDFGCATNTDNPFSVFLRSEHRDLMINKPGRAHNNFANDNNLLSRSSVGSSDMSSGSFPGVFWTHNTILYLKLQSLA